jgi:hypothetical protein
MNFQAGFAILAVTLGAVATGCDAAPTIGAQREIVEDQVSSRVSALRDAWARLDAPAVVSFYSDRSLDTYNGDRSAIDALREWAAADGLRFPRLHGDRPV